MSLPLLITADSELADDVARLAAVAGCELERHDDFASQERGWSTAPAIVLDGPAALDGASAGLFRRRGVLIVCREPTPEVWRAAVELSAERVLELPSGEAELVDFLSDAVEISAPRSGRVLAVLGGCGGAGASVFAAATALTAARRGDHALLLDCDPLGGGLDLAVGIEDRPGLRWSGLTVSGGRVSASALRAALPEHDVGSGTLAVLSCDRDDPASGLTPQALRAVISAGRRVGETVVCDLPRALSEVSAVGLRSADLTVVVVPSELRACAAAARLVAGVREVSAAPVYAVVRGPAPSGLKVTDVEAAVGLEALAAMRPQSGLAAVVDRGGLGYPGGLGSGRRLGEVARAARAVLAALDDADSVVGSTALAAAR